MSIPRIITVDPTWTLARILRAALDLLDRPIVQVDVPGSTEALAELKQGCTLVVTNYEVDENTRGFELALRIKRESPDTSVIIVGEAGDPEEHDHETAAESPYAYLRRPMDIQKFIRVLQAGLEGGSLHDAMFPSAMEAPVLNNELGPVPGLDIDAAQKIIDTLRVDVAAQAILLATRTGQVLLERGAVGIINREKLTVSLLPAVLTNIEAKDLLGGQLSSVQFYDGDEFDVYVLTVGLHHFLCVIFDGQNGSRQFGAVNRFGRKAVEELIAKIGALAFFLQPRTPMIEEKPQTTRKKPGKSRETEEVEMIPLARAEMGGTVIPAPEPEPLKLEPIAELNLDDLFSDKATNVDEDALFDLDELEELANQNTQNSKGKLDWDTARNIGLIPD